MSDILQAILTVTGDRRPGSELSCHSCTKNEALSVEPWGQITQQGKITRNRVENTPYQQQLTQGRQIQVAHASAIEAILRKQLGGATLIMQGVRK